MTIPVMFFVTIAAAVVQSAVPGFSMLARAKMPLLLGVVLYYALARRRETMLLAAVTAGFVQDAISPVPFGYSALCFCVAGLAANSLREEVFSESMFTAAFFGAAAGGLVTLGTGALLWRGDLLGDPLWRIALKAGGAALLGAVCTPIVFWMTRGLDRMVGNVSSRRTPLDDEEIGYI